MGVKKKFWGIIPAVDSSRRCEIFFGVFFLPFKGAKLLNKTLIPQVDSSRRCENFFWGIFSSHKASATYTIDVTALKRW